MRDHPERQGSARRFCLLALPRHGACRHSGLPTQAALLRLGIRHKQNE